MNNVEQLTPLHILKDVEITTDRKEELTVIAQQLKTLLNEKKELNLNFVCTHNSRRSQFSQAWSYAISSTLELPIKSYSSGTETTACNERTIASLKRAGFIVDQLDDSSNPIYDLRLTKNETGISLFSKTIDNREELPSSFIALMTCSHADENCPFIPEAEARIPFRFEDPKAFDDTDLETIMYDTRSKEIGAQLLFIFNQLK